LILVEALAVEHRSDTNDSGTGTGSELDFTPPFIDLAQQASHIANTCYSVREEKRQRTLSGVTEVDVHVPQSGDHKFSASVDASRVRGHAHLRALPNIGNSIALHEDRHVW
jgi:hypothetical protein